MARRSSRKLVLVVEDDPGLRRELCVALEQAGYPAVADPDGLVEPGHVRGRLDLWRERGRHGAEPIGAGSKNARESLGLTLGFALRFALGFALLEDLPEGRRIPQSPHVDEPLDHSMRPD